jgi:hypothetical protein
MIWPPVSASKATLDEAWPTPARPPYASFARIPELGGGRVLGCWCHPLPCHGHLLAELVNRDAADEGAVEQIAKAMAEVMANRGAN